MKRLGLLTLLALAACTDPTLTTGMIFTPDGVAVVPTLSGRVGEATVFVQP